MSEGGHNRGRAVSWLAVVIILGGFTLGGLALVFGRWWLFWVAFGIVVVGGILAVAIDIFADVQLDPLHQSDADPHVSPVRHEIAGRTLPGLDPAVATADGGGEPPAAAEPPGTTEETTAPPRPATDH